MQLATLPALKPTSFDGFASAAHTSKLVAAVEDHYTPFGPIRKGRVWQFAQLDHADQLDLAYATTVLPPKHVFRPTVETLFDYFQGKLQEPFVANGHKPAALIGVHACDLHALQVLDAVYEQQERDPYYARRRANALVVALACEAPTSSCFCTLMETGPSPHGGYDILLTPTAGGYLVSAEGNKGAAVVSQLEFEPVTDGLVHAAQVKFNQALAALEHSNRGFATPTISINEVANTMTHSAWKEVAADCLGCGACTITCPTCFCYDVVDEPNLTNDKVQRTRHWDSCLYLRFSEMAGHSAGLDLASRLQQRLYHKWVFHSKQFGTPGCVGCGRCITSCTAQIDPRQLLAAVRRETDDLV